MQKLWIAFALVAAMCFDDRSTSAQTASAVELLSGTRKLTAADVAVIQAAVRSALAGKYAVYRLVAPAEVDLDRQDEFLLDDRGRTVFHRYLLPDTAQPGVRRYTILEFTDIPAVRCADRSALPGRRLGFTYYEDWKGWHLGNPMVVDAEGSPWATGSPGYDFLHAAASDVRDLGIRQISGRTARGLSITGAPVEKKIWIDAALMLPVQESIGGTLEGKSFEVIGGWTYPMPRPIDRPQGIARPDCA